LLEVPENRELVINFTIFSLLPKILERNMKRLKELDFLDAYTQLLMRVQHDVENQIYALRGKLREKKYKDTAA
jgi:hypothetical protein